MNKLIKNFDLFKQAIKLRNKSYKQDYDTFLGICLSYIVIITLILYAILYFKWMKNSEYILAFEKFFEEDSPKVLISNNWVSQINKTLDYNMILKKINPDTFFASLGFGLLEKNTSNIVPIDLTYLNIEVLNLRDLTDVQISKYKEDTRNFFKSDEEKKTINIENSNNNNNLSNNSSSVYYKNLYYKKCDNFKGISDNLISDQFNQVKKFYCIYSNFTISKKDKFIIKVNTCTNKTYTAADSESIPDFIDKSNILPLQYFKETFLSKCPNILDKIIEYDKRCYLYNYYDSYGINLLEYYFMKESFYQNPNLKSFIIYTLDNLKNKKLKTKDELVIIEILEFSLNEYSKIDSEYKKQTNIDKYYMSFKSDLATMYDLGKKINDINQKVQVEEKNDDNIEEKKVNFTNTYYYTPPLSSFFIPYNIDSYRIEKKYIECKPQKEIEDYINNHLFLLFTSFDKLDEHQIVNNLKFKKLEISPEFKKNYLVQLAKKSISVSDSVFTSLSFVFGNKQFFIQDDKNLEYSSIKNNSTFIEVQVEIIGNSSDLRFMSSDIFILFFSLGGIFLFLNSLIWFLFGNYFEFIAILRNLNYNTYFRTSSKSHETPSFEEYIFLRYNQIKIIKRIQNDKLRLENSQATYEDKEKNQINNRKISSSIEKKYMKKSRIDTNEYIYVDTNLIENSSCNKMNEFISEEEITFCHNFINFQEIYKKQNLQYLKKNKTLRLKNSVKARLNGNFRGYLKMDLKTFIVNRIYEERNLLFQKLKLNYIIITKTTSKKLNFSFLEYIIYRFFCCRNKKLQEKISLYEKAKINYDIESDINTLIKAYNQAESMFKIFFMESNYEIFNNLPNKCYFIKNKPENKSINTNFKRKLSEKILRKNTSEKLQMHKENEEDNYNVNSIEAKFSQVHLLDDYLKKLINSLNVISNNERNNKVDFKILRSFGFNKDSLKMLEKLRNRYKEKMIKTKINNKVLTKYDIEKVILKDKTIKKLKKNSFNTKVKQINPVENFITLSKKKILNRPEYSDSERFDDENENIMNEIINKFNIAY